MPDFYFFNANKQYEDEEGNPITLGEHLDYVDNYLGTPDCWDTFTGHRSSAMNEAKASGLELYVVDAVSCRVVGHVNA